ncbi:MAG: hypothetical protein GY906_28450 [bacterium]|nr:hypothetical protein [bacterium]
MSCLICHGTECDCANQNPTMGDVQCAKRDMEQAIHHLVQSFEAYSGATVESIDLAHQINLFEEYDKRTIEVKAEVKL